MVKITAKEIASFAKGEPKRYAIENGLYFVVPKSGSSYWMLRYTTNKKRKEMSLGKLSDMTLADARLQAALNMKQLREGLDPLLVKKRANQAVIQTVDELYEDWQLGNVKRLKHPSIPARVYKKDISPHIGSIKASSVTARDIRDILRCITDTNRPAIANDALMYCKQLFNHGIKLDVIGANPASAFSVTDAGGVEKSKDRALSIEELAAFFKIAREQKNSFSRDNYLACALLVSLGIRKSELTEAMWSEFDLEAGIWSLPKERSKSGVGIEIPLSAVVVEWIQELHVRACGADYLLPNRRASKSPFMGADTLNRAITKLFGKEPGKVKQPPNVMGDIMHFTVHDLRRTCRTLLASQGTPGHVAERCLNHKLKGVEGIYNRHDYFDERREALTKLALTVNGMDI
jgi:integrase